MGYRCLFLLVDGNNVPERPERRQNVGNSQLPMALAVQAQAGDCGRCPTYCPAGQAWLPENAERLAGCPSERQGQTELSGKVNSSKLSQFHHRQLCMLQPKTNLHILHGSQPKLAIR